MTPIGLGAALAVTAGMQEATNPQGHVVIGDLAAS
jgi:hypothetical protein